jgi:hypothetical protein
MVWATCKPARHFQQRRRYQMEVRRLPVTSLLSGPLLHSRSCIPSCSTRNSVPFSKPPPDDVNSLLSVSSKSPRTAARASSSSPTPTPSPQFAATTSSSCSWNERGTSTLSRTVTVGPWSPFVTWKRERPRPGRKIRTGCSVRARTGPSSSGTWTA